MNAVKETKINQILQLQPSGAVFLSSWMKQKGISYELQRNYKKSGWFDSFGTGALIRKGDTPIWQSALDSLCHQTELKIHVGAKSALNLQGFGHYLAFNEQKIDLFSARAVILPNWLLKYNWNIKLQLNRTNFLTTSIGLTDYSDKQFTFQVSTPSRAIMESLFLSNEDYEFIESYQIMESLTSLRPDEVQELLENCHSVKVVRLFLFMAEKAKHSWFKHIDQSKIEFGKGKRMLVKDGIFLNSYQITIPNELAGL